MRTGFRMIKEVILLNDKKSSHLKYRMNIYNKLKARGCSIMLYEIYSVTNILKIILTNTYIISSNIKCNILVLLFRKRNSTIILNGIGRYKKNRIFRFIISVLLRSYKGKLIIQNYHDFRYFKLKHKIKNSVWLLGSGASVRRKGNSEKFFTITRDNKILSQTEEIRDFISKENSIIHVVGVDSIPLELRENLQAVGVVSQADIFKMGYKFIWFGGYGDGFPHSLAEALYNGLEVILSRRQYVQLGLRLIVKKKIPYRNGWLKIIQINKHKLGASYIADRTLFGVLGNEC